MLFWKFSTFSLQFATFIHTFSFFNLILYSILAQYTSGGSKQSSWKHPLHSADICKVPGTIVLQRFFPMRVLLPPYLIIDASPFILHFTYFSHIIWNIVYPRARAWVSTGAVGACHPPTFWTSPLAPAGIEVLNTNWHPQSSFYVTSGTLSFKFLTQALCLQLFL